MARIFDEDLYNEFYEAFGTNEFERWVDDNVEHLDEIMESVLAEFRGVMPGGEVERCCRALQTVSQFYVGMEDNDPDRIARFQAFYRELMLLPFTCAEISKSIFKDILQDSSFRLDIPIRRYDSDSDLIAGIAQWERDF